MRRSPPIFQIAERARSRPVILRAAATSCLRQRDRKDRICPPAVGSHFASRPDGAGRQRTDAAGSAGVSEACLVSSADFIVARRGAANDAVHIRRKRVSGFRVGESARWSRKKSKTCIPLIEGCSQARSMN